MTSRHLRVGIVGAGQAGMRHVVGFGAHGDAELVGLAETDPRRREAAAREAACPGFASWEELLRQQLDVLVVALPHSLHVDPVLAAAETGVHVLVEKPIATTLADARTIVQACRDANTRLGISFVHRFREEARRAYSWIARLGDPLLARETLPSERTATHPAWLDRAAVSGGGVLMYSAIHSLDRLRWYLGAELARVDARTARIPGTREVEDGVVALLEYDNGAVATLSACAPTYPVAPGGWETEIYATRGHARVRTRAWAEARGTELDERYETASDPAAGVAHYNFIRQARDFLDAIREEREPEVTGSDGVRALEGCLAIYASAREGTPVTVNEVATA